MLTSYGNDSDATHLLDSYNFHIVPVMNPDGYDYTWTDVSTQYLELSLHSIIIYLALSSEGNCDYNNICAITSVTVNHQ